MKITFNLIQYLSLENLYLLQSLLLHHSQIPHQHVYVLLSKLLPY